MEGNLIKAKANGTDAAAAEYARAARGGVPAAYRLAGYILGDACEAQDAVQDALVKAWRNWGSLRDHDAFHSTFVKDEVAAAVGRLSDDQRLVIALRFWSDLTLEQVAERLGLPLGTVKSRLHYALRALRRELGGGTNEA